MTLATGLGTLLAVGLCWLSGPPPPAGASPIVHLLVFAHATMDGQALAVANATTRQLFDPAGIDTEWRNCGGADGACPQTDNAMQVIVLLMPMAKFTREDVAAEVLHGGSTTVTTVLVYLPNLADRLRTVQRSAAGRSNPPLATLRLEHLVGLAIAHEIGHAFGLAHGPSGVMKARIVPDDLLALATSRLAFTSKDAAALRQSVLARGSAERDPRQSDGQGPSDNYCPAGWNIT
jgi:hypothetical protein